MSAMASQITSLTIVYSTFYSGADQRKHQSFAALAFVCGNSPVTGEFTAQMASNAENLSIWWRHHGVYLYLRLKRLIAPYSLICRSLWAWICLLLKNVDEFISAPLWLPQSPTQLALLEEDPCPHQLQMRTKTCSSYQPMFKTWRFSWARCMLPKGQLKP